MNPQPVLTISLVVIEVAGGEALLKSIRHISEFLKDFSVVVREENPQLKSAFPSLHVIVDNSPVPLRRKNAIMAEKSSDVVVLLEDTSLFSREALQAIDDVFKDSQVSAASGPVVTDTKLAARYQALGCTEYGIYHPAAVFSGIDSTVELPPLSQVVDRLPGNCLSYRTEAILALLKDNTSGLVEGKINALLQRKGGKLVIDSRLTTLYSGEDVWGARIKTRFSHGRVYAGVEANLETFTSRLVHALKALLLPLVLSVRSLKCLALMSEIRSVRAKCHVLFWVVLYQTAWACGECVGALFGAASSLEHWR